MYGPCYGHKTPIANAAVAALDTYSAISDKDRTPGDIANIESLRSVLRNLSDELGNYQKPNPPPFYPGEPTARIAS